MSVLSGLVERIARDLRFPTLFWLTAGLFLLDLLLPDLLPLADELLLGLATLLLASWKRRRTPPPDDGAPPAGRVVDVEPERR